MSLVFIRYTDIDATEGKTQQINCKIIFHKNLPSCRTERNTRLYQQIDAWLFHKIYLTSAFHLFSPYLSLIPSRRSKGLSYECTFYWWLVELPMWLTDGFSVTFFGRWRGQCAYTLIPVWHMCGSRTRLLTCRGGGIANIEKLGNFGKLQFLIKVVGSISGHIGSHEW